MKYHIFNLEKYPQQEREVILKKYETNWTVNKKTLNHKRIKTEWS
jgi:hypothetical protein